MSFRGRLRVFFALIVLVPLAVVTIVAFALTANSERGKADAGLATAQRTAAGLFREASAQAAPAVRRLAADEPLRDALVRGDRSRARQRLRQLVAQPGGPVAAALSNADGARLALAGSPDAVAQRALRLQLPGQDAPLLLSASVTEARVFTGRVTRLTGLDAALYRGDRLLVANVPEPPAAPPSPDARELSAGGIDYRVRSTALPEPVGPPVELLLLRDAASIDSQVADSRVLILVIVAVFLIAAIVAAAFVSRALTGQIGAFLAGARRLARGDFSHPIRIRGKDEFAQLGDEFNDMSGQLESKIDEVERKRAELEETIRRVGDALATGLERQGVVDLAVRQAVEGCGAQVGRAIPLDTDAFERSVAGSTDGALDAALEAAERVAFEPRRDTGRELLAAVDPDVTPPQRRAVTAESGAAHAAAVAMRSVVAAPGTSAEYVGVLSIARRSARFSPRELELLEYLAGQSVVSIENASLHSAVQRQAVTDELTGLANVRAMHAILERELERARRFGNSVAIVMLDIDNFKKVNDTYGHQRGDEVLAGVAGVLRDLSRDIDAPARYGGEEMVVVLPGTDGAGAAQLAERMREGVERLHVPLGDDEYLRVTASFGVAAMPESAAGKAGLIAAADAALYRAKRGGKNRVELAEPVAAPS
jgi:diguanylate cyclase (GGDEF)-like protein